MNKYAQAPESNLPARVKLALMYIEDRQLKEAIIEEAIEQLQQIKFNRR